MMANRTVVALLFAFGCGEGSQTIEVSVSPGRQWYQSGQTIELTGMVSDQAGQPVESARVTWSVEPFGAASIGGDQAVETAVLGREGRITFTGCVSGGCDSVVLQVDDGSPVLEIETPRPGAESDHPAGIEVRGSVADSSVPRVYIGGQSVDVDELGRFETVVEAEFGANHIIATASDGLTEQSSVELDALWAPAFAAALGDDGTPELELESGVAVSLGQDLFDDGVALDPDVTPVVTSDLTDILTLVAARLPLADQIPDPVIEEPGSFVLRIPAAYPGSVESSIDVTGGGVELFLRLPELRLDTEGAITIEGNQLDLGGHVIGSVAAVARIDVTKPAGAPPAVELIDLLVGLETITSHFDSDESNAIFLLAEGTLRTTIEDQLLGGLTGALETSLPALLGEVITGLDTALADRELVLDQPLLGAPITVQLDGRIDSVTARTGVELETVLRTRAGTTTESTAPDSLGVPILTPGGSAAAFFRDRALQVGVRLAFLNGLLHSLWSSGALEIDLTDQVAGELGGLITGARLSAKMTPVVRPPRAGETDRLVVSLAQVELDLDLEGGDHARFGLGIDNALDVDIVDNALVVLAPGDPRIRIWTIEAAEASIVSEELIATVVALQWPELRDSLVGNLQVDLPVPSLGGLGALAPDLADLALSFELVDPAAVRQGVVLLDGALRGELP